MKPRELRDHKRAIKVLKDLPVFKPIKRNTLPKPFDQLGRRSHVYAAGPISISTDHALVFLYRDGEIFTDSCFYGYFACVLANGSFSLLMEFHWHPSHKGLHCKTPCGSQENYSGRLLAHAPELNLASDCTLDPRMEGDRLELIRLFCKACNVTMKFSEADQFSLLQ